MKSEILIPKLIKACLDNDRRMVEEISILFLKVLKKDNPALSQEIAQALASSQNGISALRSEKIQPLPIDRESRFALAKAEEPVKVQAPILVPDTLDSLKSFIEERKTIEKLVEEELSPPSSLVHSQYSICG